MAPTRALPHRKVDVLQNKSTATQQLRIARRTNHQSRKDGTEDYFSYLKGFFHNRIFSVMKPLRDNCIDIMHNLT